MIGFVQYMVLERICLNQKLKKSLRWLFLFFMCILFFPPNDIKYRYYFIFTGD